MDLFVKTDGQFNDETSIIKTISSVDFVDSMEKHWTEELKLISNPALRESWKQTINIFNYHIHNHEIPEIAQKWTVLSPPTGSGKTQSIQLYAALLAQTISNDAEHPAILIITRRKVDCDEIVKQINKYGQRDTAIAYHGDTKRDFQLSKLKNHPVIVITHKAYQLALDNLGHEGFKQQTWSYFMAYDRGGNLGESLEGQFHLKKEAFDVSLSSRRLVIIDESIDIVNHYMVSIYTLRGLRYWFPDELQIKFAQEFALIDNILSTLQLLDENRKQLKDEQPNEVIRDRIIMRKGFESRLQEAYGSKITNADLQFNFDGLIAELKGINPDQMLGKSIPSLNKEIRQHLEEVLRSLKEIYTNWVYYTNEKHKNGLHSSKLIVPQGLKGCVVMDATASTNKIYRLHKDCIPVKPIEGCRDYSNVNLHVGYGYGTGRSSIMPNEYEARRNAEQLMGDLNERLKGRKVLIVCHKGIKDLIKCFDSTFEKRYVDYYGNLDGSNQYKDCDAVVLFGLNHRGKIWATNIFFALQGLPDSNDWFHDPEERAFKGFKDVREDLANAQLSVDTIQALNRVRCRKTIDDKGNCPKTDVYILLGDDSRGKHVKHSIVKAMPNINVDYNFNYNAVKRKAKKIRYEEALSSYLKDQNAGEYTKKALIKRYGMGARQFEKIVAKAKVDPECLLARTMEEENISYHVTGHGRGAKAFFLKSN